MTAETRGTAFVYVGTYTNGDDGIYRYRMDLKTGALEPAGTTPAYNPFFLLADRTGKLLYATVSRDGGEDGAYIEGEVAAYAIEPSGELTLLNTERAHGAFPCYLELDRAQRHLLVGNYNSGSVAVLPVAEDGRLGAATDVVQHSGSSVNEERQEGPHVHSVVLDPAERFAYAADLGIDRHMIYAFDAGAGKLTPASQPWAETVPGAGPRHFSFDPDGARAYLLNELDGTVTLFDFDADSGGLSERQTISALPADFTDENYAADLSIPPPGDFLYCTNRGHDSIAVFAIDRESGLLTFIAHEPAQGSWPWNLEIDPAGRFMLAANYESDSVAVWRIDSGTGRLTPAGHGAEVPKPTGVVMAPAAG